MNHSRQFQNISFYNSIAEIPQQVWLDLNCSSNIYFHPDYLKSLEENNSQLTFFYAIVKDEQQKAIALATAQVIDFYIDSIPSDSKGMLHTMACIGRKLKILPREKPLKILNCGNPFVSGEHGVFIVQNQDRKKVIRTLAKAVLNYTESYFDFSIDVFIMKDFKEESLPITNELINLGYYAFNVEPNMRMKISADWKSFDDYLAVVKTKFRVKAKKALTLSDDLQVQQINAENLEMHSKAMTELYLKVTSKASFNLGEFRLKTYQQLKEKFGDDYLLQSYWLRNKMVGFLSGAINGKTLDAHFVGIDYKLNKSYGIYQRMLYDYIQIAIDNQLQTINFGRTASEIKSSVGAVPEHLTIYMRHKKTITNKFLRLFLHRIQPTEFNQKFPFKQIAPSS